MKIKNKINHHCILSVIRIPVSLAERERERDGDCGGACSGLEKVRVLQSRTIKICSEMES
jgi:hypothetical protein